MKAYIELKNGFGTINDKRASYWTFEEKELINEFLKIIKSEEQEPPKNSSLLERLGRAFFQKQPTKSYWLTKKDNFLLIKQTQ